MKKINEFILQPVNEAYCHQIPGNNIVREAFVETNSIFTAHGGFGGLNRTPVVYAISDGGNGWYIGSTDDFGERIHTHIQKSRSEDSLLQNKIRESGRFYVRILAVCDTIEEAERVEESLIAGWRYHIIKNKIGIYRFKLMSKQEQEKTISVWNYNKIPKIAGLEN